MDWARDELDAPVGLLGDSYGGHWALWATALAPRRVGATVVFYAARAGDFRDTPIQAHLAEHDDWVPTSARRRFEGRLPEGKIATFRDLLKGASKALCAH